LQLHVGLDDTDSPEGGCTTHIIARLVEQLYKLGVTFTDYPNLLRLNPNVPWKTRGNGAVCLRFLIDDSQLEEVKQCILKEVKQNSKFDCDNTNPGVVFHKGDVPPIYKEFSKRVISSVVKLDDAKKVIREGLGEAVGFKNERGLIGAIAAIGGLYEGDYTFELLTYRNPDNYGTKRMLDEDSVWAMNLESGETYNNVDKKFRRVLIAPRGPDPVLFGIRGETAKVVWDAGRRVVSLEPITRWVIFRSNQGTDNHLKNLHKINELQPMTPAKASGKVSKKSWTITGGHVFFTLQDETGEIDCAAYEPTGNFRENVRMLIPEDRVTAYGGVRNDKEKPTLNLEKLEITLLAKNVQYVNPRCPTCRGSMESMGMDKGYRCRHCGYRDGKLVKVPKIFDRELEIGMFFPQPGAQRHLSKPSVRYGKEKHGDYVFQLPDEPWFGIGNL